MELRSDLFYIFLIIYYLLDFGGASSDDDDDVEPVGGKKHKWTPEEEGKLIFYEVLTDTGKPGHLERIRDEWHKEYPTWNITADTLRNKLHRLRHESLEEGELKKNFKWNLGLEQELIDVYHTTQPYMKDANISLEEEWKRRHPDFQREGNYLLWRVRSLFRKYKYLRYRKPGSSIAPSLVEDLTKKSKHCWTVYEKARLLHLYKLKDMGERKNLSKIKLAWRKEFPEANVTDIALYHMLRKLHQESSDEGDSAQPLNY